MQGENYISALKKFDSLYKDFYNWLAGQYDSKYGGFYYARSSKGNEEFQPDIESTAQAISILNRSDLINSMPKWMKEQIIEFFQKRQTPEGYFLDPHNNMYEVDRMVARAVGYSSNCLKILGARPLYPLPGVKGLDSLPYYMKSLEIYRKWMDERPWDYSWMACDNISASGNFIRSLPDGERKQFLDMVWKYLEDHQDSETGMWGDGRPYIKISGAFKLALFYQGFNKPMPRAEKIYQYLLKTLKEDISEDMCWTRNPMDLLVELKPQIGSYSDKDTNEILTVTYNNLKKYLKPDGGFSRHVEYSLEVPNNVPLGKGLIEGDMNASTQALRIRTLCHDLVGITEKPLYQYSKGFYESMIL